MQATGQIAIQPWMAAKATRAVMTALTTDGTPARFVGGSVRDALLGRPVKDIDVATPLAPGEIVARIEGAGLKAIPTGLAHGTVTALSGRQSFEITTLREDVETYGRHAKVAFTDDWVADAARRDFTFNAMFADSDGVLYDPFQGAIDLFSGRVRFVGDARQRIAEDVLRLLRFFRFHAHYGTGAPDSEGLSACQGFVDRIGDLSGERLRDELLRLLGARDPVPTLCDMAGIGALAPLFPDVKVDFERAMDRLAGLVAIEQRLNHVDSIRRLAALARDSVGDVVSIAERLRLSNVDRDRLAAVARPATEPQPGLTAHQVRVAIYRMGPDLFRDLTFTAWAADRDDHGYGPLLARGLSWLPPALPIAGRDMLRLGLRPGPHVGRVLGELEQWWIDGDFVADHDALLARARDLCRSGDDGG